VVSLLLLPLGWGRLLLLLTLLLLALSL